MTNILKEYGLALSVILFLLGVAMLCSGVFWYCAYIQKLTFPYALSGIAERISFAGDWGWWLFIPSFFVFIVGAWYLGDQTIKRKKFRSIIKITSKANFVKNIHEIEDLVAHLPAKYKTELEDKKKVFKL